MLEHPAAEVLPPHQVLAAVLERIVAMGEERVVELHRAALQAWAEAARDREIMAIYRREGRRGRVAWTTYVGARSPPGTCRATLIRRGRLRP
ncbi:hypothetical protein ABQF17_03610 [Mycolicibacterium elephantis]|uniref:Uncharacterized protein n=1 Tax=Mycolicibacterium elephantis TaxID=81858 RepID=A0A0M2ZFY4_9MYCO|nr:hypothetical protein [Mycolicibacterium elephantis]KKW64347.1 hypothetical protein AAV95_12405 [Mycolicibacterium elephantis]OBA77126.1 hypothetical protein A5633_18550 [Mycolicibacterium elephantis]OBE98572.1 hypothetical protein A5776_14185 [Mycolicibacterium elephantis]ORA59578.1 hypothetical protein BST23_24190 [Mycolicibacterium elephantis]